MQTRIHVKVVGLVLILRGTFQPECSLGWNLNRNRSGMWQERWDWQTDGGAARTLDVQVCSTHLATVDTT